MLLVSWPSVSFISIYSTLVIQDFHFPWWCYYLVISLLSLVRNCSVFPHSYSFLFWLISGKPLSVLDGIPIAVKDEIDCLPYPTTGSLVFLFSLAVHQVKYVLMHVCIFYFIAWYHLVLVGGTSWLHKLRPCTGDASCIKYLRLCGALIVGKTNMHELGIGTSGINPHYGWDDIVLMLMMPNELYHFTFYIG